MSNLNIQNVDLTSMERGAAKNGAPSSRDYTDSQREVLADLIHIADCINETFLPMFNALEEGASEGVSGKNIYADPTADTPLFYDPVNAKPLTIRDVCQNLDNRSGQLENTVKDVLAKVLKLQTLLSTTGHNDVYASVQNFSDQIKNLGSQLNSVVKTLGTFESKVALTRSVRVDIGDVPAAGTLAGDVFWDLPFPSNDYTATLSIEDPTSSLDLQGWSKLAAGRGIHYEIFNPGGVPVTGAILHMIGQSNEGSA